MSRLLAGFAMTASAIAVVGCGSSTTTVRNTVVTVVKTVETPAPEAPAPQSTPAPAPAPAAARQSVTLPDVVGQRLDVAELHLRARHIRYREVGGGTFGIIVKSNWMVCEQEPAAGTTDPSRVSLIVDREC